MFAAFQFPAFKMDMSPVRVPTWLRGISFGQIGNLFAGVWDVVYGVLVLAAIVGFIYFYGKALHEVKAGRLIVYASWSDFGKSAAGPILILVGLSWLLDGGTMVLRLLGLIGIGYGCYFTYGLFAGAFKYNYMPRAWLALFARIAAMMLMFFALAKLEERFKNYRRGVYGRGFEAVVRGVVIPLAIFAWGFRTFIQPMVRKRY